MSKEHRVNFSFDARYLTEGDSESDVLWICLHGYAQLAPYFIRKFEVLYAQDQVIVPEGLHRFYMNDGSGRVVASWMTKEDREADIKNYLSYLDVVIADALSKRAKAPKEIRLLGFSQGVATACRYYAHTSFKISSLILWAGALPPDLKLEAMKGKQEKSNIFLIHGDEDPYMKDSPYLSSTEVLDQLGYNYTLHTFHGKHEIKKEELLFLAQTLRS